MENKKWFEKSNTILNSDGRKKWNIKEYKKLKDFGYPENRIEIFWSAEYWDVNDERFIQLTETEKELMIKDGWIKVGNQLKDFSFSVHYEYDLTYSSCDKEEFNKRFQIYINSLK